MANRMGRSVLLRASSTEKVANDEQVDRRVFKGPLSVWTTAVWQREATLMRWCEVGLVRAVQRWVTLNDNCEVDRFVKDAQTNLSELPNKPPSMGGV